jgi:hypothetical protein
VQRVEEEGHATEDDERFLGDNVSRSSHEVTTSDELTSA